MKKEATVSLEACEGVHVMWMMLRGSLPLFVNRKLAKFVCQLSGTTAPNPTAGGATSTRPSSSTMDPGGTQGVLLEGGVKGMGPVGGDWEVGLSAVVMSMRVASGDTTACTHHKTQLLESTRA